MKIFIKISIVFLFLLTVSQALAETLEPCEPTKVSNENIKRCLSKLNEFDQKLMIGHAINTDDPEKGVILLLVASGIMSSEEKIQSLKMALKGNLGPTIIVNKAIINTLGSFYIRLIVKSMCQNKQPIPDSILKRAKVSGCEEVLKEVDKKTSDNEVANIPMPPTGGFGYSKNSAVKTNRPSRPAEEIMLPGEKIKREREAKERLEALKRAAEEAANPKKAQAKKESPLMAAIRSGDDFQVIKEIKGGASVEPENIQKVLTILLANGRKGIYLALKHFGYNLTEQQRQQAIDNYVGGGGNLERILKTVPLKSVEVEVIIYSAASRKEQKRLSKIRPIPFSPAELDESDEDIGGGLK